MFGEDDYYMAAKTENVYFYEDEYPKPKKKHLFLKILLAIFLVILVFALGVVVGWNVLRVRGKQKLMATTEEYVPIIENEETMAASEEEKATWKEGWIKYNDSIYEYDEDLITFLFMGIDKNSEVKEVAEGTNGGQADALFLMVLDKNEQKINIIGINRNTMTDIDVYNEYGDYVTTTKAQIAVQHGFGNGVEESCEYQVNAVRKLFYNIPIHGYAAINMNAIPVLNDAVGGVDVRALSNIKNGSGILIINKDDAVHLEGSDAFWYVKYRDVDEFASADMRLARQKQYLTEFVAKAKNAVKEDSSILSSLYNAITPYMVTNVSFDEIAYIAPEAMNYSFDMDAIKMIQGETVQGEVFEEFNVDETALYDLIIDVFYKEIKD